VPELTLVGGDIKNEKIVFISSKADTVLAVSGESLLVECDLVCLLIDGFVSVITCYSFATDSCMTHDGETFLLCSVLCPVRLLTV